MEGFASFVIRHRLILLVVLAVLTVWLGVEAASIPVDTDVLNFLPDSDPDVRFFKETGGKFGSNYINMVAMEADDLFSTEALSALRRLTQAIERVNGVRQVLGLTNMMDMRRNDGSLEVSTLIPHESIPTDPAILADLKRRALADPMLVGNLISADGRVALISVRIEENADKEAVARQIKLVAPEMAAGHTLYFGGFSMIMEYMGRMIAKDMSRLVPYTVLVLLLVLYLSFSNLRGVLLPMGAVVIANVWTLGTMSMFGLALSMLTSVIPVVIIAIGTASGIYLLVRYYEISDETDPSVVTERALNDVFLPVALSGFTMVLGFLSLLTSPWDFFKDFGIAAAIGSLFAMILSLTFIPAVLAFLPLRPSRAFAFGVPGPGKTTWLLCAMGRAVAKLGKPILVAGVLAGLASLVLIPRIPRNVDLMSYFPEGSEPRVAETLLQEHFGGSQLFIVNFRAQDVREPAILEQMTLLGKRLRTMPDVHLPQSPADVVMLLNRLLNDQPGLPDSLDKVRNLWFFLEGQASIEMLMESNFSNGVLQARIGEIDSAVVSSAIRGIEKLIDKTVETKLAYVNRSSLKPDQNKVFSQLLAQRLAGQLAQDYRFYTGTHLRSEEALRDLLEPVVLASPALDIEDRQLLADRFSAYFRDEESEIRLDPSFDAEPVCVRLASLANYSTHAITATLVEFLPSASWEDDAQLLADGAACLGSIVSQATNYKRHQRAIAVTLSNFGIDPGDESRAGLLADVRSVLWAANCEQAAFNEKQVKQITGKRPDKSDRIEFEVRLTGWPLVSTKFDAKLLSTQVKSILIALCTLFFLLALQFRSLRGGLVASIPMVFTLLMNFAVMSLLELPLDYTTMMISSIAMGIGVGYAIHFLVRYRRELEQGRTPTDALSETLSTKGRAVLINTAAVALGFLVLTFSVMQPQRQFGLMIALTMLLANLGTFVVLPAAILYFKPRFEAQSEQPGCESE